MNFNEMIHYILLQVIFHKLLLLLFVIIIIIITIILNILPYKVILLPESWKF